MQPDEGQHNNNRQARFRGDRSSMIRCSSVGLSCSRDVLAVTCFNMTLANMEHHGATSEPAIQISVVIMMHGISTLVIDTVIGLDLKQHQHQHRAPNQSPPRKGASTIHQQSL
jgi:hypothetical protein